MPTCRRKRVLLVEPSNDLLQVAQQDTNREVFFLHQTGEVFESYDAYAARMSFYKLKQFQCEVTGKGGLDYFQALESEHQEARTLHSRFPEQLKEAVLRSVQWQVVGRLDKLVEMVHDRFSDRFFEGERVYIDVQGDKFYARIVQVFPPKSRKMTQDSPERKPLIPRKRPSSETPDVSVDGNTPIPHIFGSNLSNNWDEGMDYDNPLSYFYKVQILEEGKLHNEKESDNDDEAESTTSTKRENGRARERNSDQSSDHTIEMDSGAKWAGSLMEVKCDAMTRDRLSFSKSLLRKFLRECLDRDSSLASPWVVKPALAQKYGIPSEMPEDVREKVDDARAQEIGKRKRVWEKKEEVARLEGRKTKKMLKMEEKEQKAAAKAAEAESRHREAEAKAKAAARAKANKVAAEQAAKEEAERLAAEKAKQKKKPIRYPTEDLDVRLNDRDKKAGMKIRKPVPSRNSEKLPFSETKGAFEAFLASYNFLICFGQPLHLSSFTLDDFEHALRHSVSDPNCSLLDEIHSVLIYNLRTVPFVRHAAVISLLDQGADFEGFDESTTPSVDDLVAAMADVGNNWERVPLKPSEGRQGWEEALVGCMKDHASSRNFDMSRMRSIFTKLLFEWTGSSVNGSGPTRITSTGSSPLSSPTAITSPIPASPSERYYDLPPSDRIYILQFLCNLAITSKSVHAHMEHCEEQLTALRKEKIEVNRQKKQMMEELTTLQGGKEENAQETSAPPADLSDVDSEGVTPSGEETSEAGSTVGRRASSSSRQLKLRIKAQQNQAAAKQREEARAKLASAKQALAEQRRLEEEVSKLERRLEGIERDFRKLLGVVRLKPLGRDRFYNRVWWFDGCGTSTLVGSGGTIQYGTGRLFIQGPGEFDQEILDRFDEYDLDARRREEEGDDGVLGMGEWAVYSEMEEIEEFASWLNPKGIREFALKNTMQKWWELLSAGVRKRTAEMNMNAKIPEARRSMRGKTAGSDLAREPYMLWTNRKATNN